MELNQAIELQIKEMEQLNPIEVTPFTLKRVMRMSAQLHADKAHQLLSYGDLRVSKSQFMVKAEGSLFKKTLAWECTEGGERLTRLRYQRKATETLIMAVKNILVSQGYALKMRYGKKQGVEKHAVATR